MDDFSGRLRVLELYSGIGGMHWALKESGIDFEVIQAVDVNTSANAIYQHNFPGVTVSASNITKLTLNQLKKWSPNTIMMSPPCQPFTRVGKKQDDQDIRTQSFLHLLELLKKLDHKPEYILVENVKGFEVSETRKMLLDMLNECKYSYQEFLLTPLQFGIPNCRMRYYLMAKLRPLEFAFWTSDKILEEVPVEAMPWLKYRKAENAPELVSTPVSCSDFMLCHHCATKHLKQSQSPVQSAVQSPFLVCHSCGRGNKPHAQVHVRDDGDAQHEGERDREASASAERVFQRTCDYCQTTNLSQHLGIQHKCASGAGDETSCYCLSSGMEGVKVTQPLESLIVHKHAGVPKCADNDSLLSGKIAAKEPKSIAEAGRSMRHCEEEDALVCWDGTKLEDYLEKKDDEYLQQFLLSDKDLRMFVIMDLVHPSFKKSSCFTKRYGRYVEGAGSLIMMTDDIKVVKEASEFKTWAVEHKNRQDWGEAELSILKQLRLRYFTPREVANLLCFPSQFAFPEGLNTIQCYRVLGNSLNVHVVAVLVQLMLMEPGVI